MTIDKTLDIYENILRSYKNRMYSIGLTKEDYEEVNALVKRLYDLKAALAKTNTNKELNMRIQTILLEFEKIKRLLRVNVLPNTLNVFLSDECSLVPLVLANNHDKRIYLYARDGYKFVCQFHKGDGPMLGVCNYKRIAHCFGCKKTVKLIDYIMEIEKLDYQSAIYLLAKAYMIDLENRRFDDEDELVLKYRNILLSEKYRDLLVQGINRTSKMDSSIERDNALEVFEHDLNTIERIKNGESLQYNGRKPKKKVLVLKPKTDNGIKTNY